MIETKTVPGHDVTAHTPTPPTTTNDPMPLLKLVGLLRQGAISARNLSLNDRRAAVNMLVVEGYSTHEIAAILNLSDRTIERDRAAIRQANAVRPDDAGGDQIIGELKRQAEVAMHRLQRAVRDREGGPTVTPHQRIRAALHCYYIYDRLTRTLLHSKYILDGSSRDCVENFKRRHGDDFDALLNRLGWPGEAAPGALSDQAVSGTAQP